MSRPVARSEVSRSPDTAILTVALKAFLIYLALQAFVWYLGYLGWMEPLLGFWARLTFAGASLLGVPATCVGTEVFLATRVLRIDPQCTGISIAMVYAALVLAYPLGWRSKLVGLALGLPAIFLANFVRLAAVAGLSDLLDERSFAFVHDYLFMTAMIAVVIVLWAVYLAWARRRATQR